MAISANEEVVFRSFHDAARRLEDHSLMKSNDIKVATSLNLNAEGASITYHKINDEQLDSYLMRLRVFYNQEENIFIRKIMNVIGREHQDSSIKAWLKDLKDLIEAKGRHVLYHLNLGGKTYTQEDIWLTYLYAERFHNDMQRQAMLRELKQIEPIAYTGFMNTVTNRTKAVCAVRGFLTHNFGGIVS